jgi:hypothetical protein
MLKKLSLVVVALAMLVSTAAFADTAPAVSATVWVWNGSLPSQNADLSMLTALNNSNTNPNWAFFYNGPIDFANNNPQGGSNTFGDFFGSNSAGISGMGSIVLNNFLNTTMSSPGPNLQSFMLFAFQLTAPAGATGTLQHDDGASLYICDNFSCSTQLVNSPGWTSLTTDTFTLAEGTHTYGLFYVEGNGSPSDLKMTAVPEPASLLLLGSGALTLAGLLRKKLRA